MFKGRTVTRTALCLKEGQSLGQPCVYKDELSIGQSHVSEERLSLGQPCV